jgi:fructose-1-phosphate kinase PfkB-like protein
LLAAVLDSEHAPYPWARRVRCAVVSTAGYVQGDEEEPFARPDAYDVTRLASDMQRLRKPPSWSDVDLVDLAGAEGFADLRLVLVHGRHVLRREGEWEALAGQFDFTVDLQRSDDDVTGSTELKDSLGRPYVPSEVASRVLRAQMELLEWQNADDADLSLRFQQRADGSLLFLPETLSIVPALRRRPSLLAAGLNPSHQKSLQLSELKVGDVNRAAALTVSVGGKGQHFAIAANRLGEGSATVAHFLGRRGEEGEQMRKALEQMGVDQEVEWHQGATRTCTTILEDSGRMTELIEPSDCIPKTAVDALLGRLRSRAQRSAGVALCGTFPPGVQEEVYAGLAESVGRDTVLLLDGWKGVEKTLASKRVNVLKINADELGWLTHETDLNAAAATAMRLYMAPGGHLAVTRGANSAFLFSHVQSGAEGPAGMRVAEFVLQPLAAVNPIGAGDTCSAVLLYALCAGQEPEEAFAFALAAASASCLNIAGAHFKAADAVSLYHKMERKPTRTLPLS